MFGRVKPIEVPEGDPFRNDKLDRGKHIIRLTDEILAHAETPLVMTLASPWGSGKSSFVAMWKGYLEDKGHVCFLFDAWQHDFSREPLLDIIGEIGGYVAQIKEPTLRERCKKIITKFGEKAATIMGICGDLAAIASCIMPGFAPIAGGLKAGKAATKSITSYLQAGHSNLKTALKDCKELLTELVGILSEKKQEPVYFFIDELDRCEPTYAIRLLEAIKHFFDVKGIIFVLSVDKVQLSSMAKTRYGEAFDADGYLRRFIDIEYTLQHPKTSDYVRHLIYDVYNYDSIFNDQFYVDSIVESCSDLCEKCNISIRTLEKAFIRSYIPIIKERDTYRQIDFDFFDTGDKYSAIKTSSKWYEIILLYSIAKEHDPKRFDRLITGHFDEIGKIADNDFHRTLRSTKAYTFFKILPSGRESINTQSYRYYSSLYLNSAISRDYGKSITLIIKDMLQLTEDVSFMSLPAEEN